MAARGKYDKENIAMLIAKLWGGITDDQFDLLKEHLETKKYKKNEIIYKNEGTPEYALCLIAGKVKIYKEGIGGKSQIIRVIKPIEFLVSEPILRMRYTRRQPCRWKTASLPSSRWQFS